MKLLLDTHVVLWSVLGDKALPDRFRAALADPEAEVFVSAASVWEVSIKRALGKLAVPQSVFDRAVEAGCTALPITWAHAQAVEALPFHHHDPFDRLLIAQARVEGLVLVTADRVFARYDVALL